MAHNQEANATDLDPPIPPSPPPSYRTKGAPSINESIPPDHHVEGHANAKKSQRPGEDIIKSDDPATAALRAWAQDKQMQYPGQDGSFAKGGVGTGGDGMGWGADSWILPHKGDKERALDAEREKNLLEKKRQEQEKKSHEGVERRESRLGSIFGIGKSGKKGDKDEVVR